MNVSSTTVPTAPPGFAHYVASKAAIVGLTRALARELGPDGICVNTLTPDYIAFDRDYDNRQPDMAPTLAAQRIFAREQTPEDMVGALLFLVGRRLRLRHGAGHLGERRSRLPLGGRTAAATSPASGTRRAGHGDPCGLAGETTQGLSETPRVRASCPPERSVRAARPLRRRIVRRTR